MALIQGIGALQLANRKSPRRMKKAAKIAHWEALPPLELPAGIPLSAVISLESSLTGGTVLRGDAEYAGARREWNPVFQAQPQMIVFCEHAGDVARALRFARDHNLWIACRSGGHSTAGYSVNSGIVIDLSGMSYVRIDTRDETIVYVGPGTDFDTLNAALDSYSLHVPGGGCGNVCVGGFMQGGGYGYTSRAFGMNCDNVEGVTVMLWDGRIVYANATNEPDLFWAIRGGTGGNFGIVLEIAYRAHRVPSVWAWAISWEIRDAAAVLVELQANFMRSGAPAELGYMAHIGCDPQQQPAFVVQGMFAGDAAAGKAAVKPLLAIGSAKLVADKSGLYGQMNTYLDDHPYPFPIIPPDVREDKQSLYIAKKLDLTDWQKIVDYYVRTSPFPGNILVIEPYGGAIQAYPSEGNAFVHRAVDMDIFVDTFWLGEYGTKARAWLDGFMEILMPHGNGEQYQNYPRASIRDFRRAYFGAAFERLLRVKQTYDPHNVFHFEQSIAPYPDRSHDRASAGAGPEAAQ